jgi:homoserine kinase type II
VAVYTVVEHAELATFVAIAGAGALRDFAGVAAGIENTNYFVYTDRGRYVLTLFEQQTAAELGYFMELMAFLAQRGVPCARPLADAKGQVLHTLRDRPAALVQHLKGSSPAHPGARQCAALGAGLAQLHQAGLTFPRRRVNPRGPAWRTQTATRLQPHLDAVEAVLLQSELKHHELHPLTGLPQGLVHADLFRDNALFDGERLCGILDFYYACDDALLLDVAVTVNDWCVGPGGRLNGARTAALLGAYGARRPFTLEEIRLWPTALRAAALRFWLSRLEDRYLPRLGAVTRTKDPRICRCLLLHHRRGVAPLGSLAG